MSIIIKDAKMPNNCWECELCYTSQMRSCPFIDVDVLWQHLYRNERHADCPIIELPEDET